MMSHDVCWCRLLQAKEPSGFYSETDGFLRQCLREYKNAKQCPVAIQMIQTLSSIPIVSLDHELIIASPNLPNIVITLQAIGSKFCYELNVINYLPYSGLISRGENFMVFTDYALSSKF